MKIYGRNTPFGATMTPAEVHNMASTFIIGFNRVLTTKYTENDKPMIDQLMGMFQSGLLETFTERKDDILRMYFRNVELRVEDGRDYHGTLLTKYECIAIDFKINAGLSINGIKEIYSVYIDENMNKYEMNVAHLSHPHVNGNGLCSGGLQNEFNRFMQIGNFVGAYHTMYRFLSGYNPGSPYFRPNCMGLNGNLGHYQEEYEKLARQGKINAFLYRGITLVEEIQNAFFGIGSRINAAVHKDIVNKTTNFKTVDEASLIDFAVRITTKNITLQDIGGICHGIYPSKVK